MPIDGGGRLAIENEQAHLPVLIGHEQAGTVDDEAGQAFSGAGAAAAAAKNRSIMCGKSLTVRLIDAGTNQTELVDPRARSDVKPDKKFSGSAFKPLLGIAGGAEWREFGCRLRRRACQECHPQERARRDGGAFDTCR